MTLTQRQIDELSIILRDMVDTLDEIAQEPDFANLQSMNLAASAIELSLACSALAHVAVNAELNRQSAPSASPQPLNHVNHRLIAR